MRAEVRAAGGVVCRDQGGEVHVLLVHRPRYDDWSFPKGKCEPGEADEAAALREVAEETGLTCRLGAELPTARYTDRHGRSKQVRYWLMEPVEIPEFVANDEVDEIRWCPPAMAATLLTYPFDRDLLERASITS